MQREPRRESIANGYLRGNPDNISEEDRARIINLLAEGREDIFEALVWPRILNPKPPDGGAHTTLPTAIYNCAFTGFRTRLRSVG